MANLIDKDVLLNEINNSKKRPIIYDGMQEVDWIMQCINSAKVLNAEEFVNEVENHLFNKFCVEGDSGIEDILNNALK